MYSVKINNNTTFVKENTLLSDVLIKNNIPHEHICGGKGFCKKCSVLVNGKAEISCQYKVTSDITVEIPETGYNISESHINKAENLTKTRCFCLDIGTTTLALALVSLDEKKIIDVKTATNPQRIFGADIMSRIAYCQKNGAEELKSILINEINSLITSFNIDTVNKMYVSGNTTMLHLFLGVDCSTIGTAPYTPVFLESKEVEAKSLNIQGVKTVKSLPSISAFIGADLVAGLNFVEAPKKDKFNMLLDLGTNAEIILFSETCVFCTSAAAGPCFEGANISQGMSATSGAIYSYTKNDVKTLNNTIPKGICGTGLIDIITVLLESNVIDKTGYMPCESIEIASNVFLEQNDIRQYQLAKSAVFSGIITLLKEKNISFNDIDKFYISGGFSTKINIENAVKTGLLPKEFKDKCIPLNNSSLLGTVKYSCEKNNLSQYLKNAEYYDLSLNKTFNNEFIKNMEF